MRDKLIAAAKHEIRKAAPVVSSIWKKAHALYALLAGGGFFGLFYWKDLELTGLEAAAYAGVSTFFGGLLLLASRAITLRDKEERTRIQRLLKLQEDYWTIQHAAVVEIDVDRQGVAPKLRIYVYNRGPDPIQMQAFRYALLPDPHGLAGLVAERYEARRVTTVVEPERRELAFEASLGGFTPKTLFRLQRCSLLASFPLRKDGEHEKQIQELQPSENFHDAPQPAP